MSGADFRQMQELEHEHMSALCSILKKMELARRDGYFTRQDVEDTRREFGLTTGDLDGNYSKS